jgi:amidase
MNTSNAFISKNKITAYTSEGVLNGLSFAVKDNIDVANEITGYGNPSWAKTHPKPVAHAICLEQLFGAGATCLGKTITAELTFDIFGTNPFYGTPLNPKAPDRVPGGSSSGSASAVAAKEVDFAIGTDTAGSIRVPASNCGVWGYRPSYAAISTSGVLSLAPSFDTVGIVAQSGVVLEKVVHVLLVEENKNSSTQLSICFLDDVLQMVSQQVNDAIEPVINKISKLFKTRLLTLADITDKHINCKWLLEKSRYLISTEVLNTFGAWVENERPELSARAAAVFNKRTTSADRTKLLSNLGAAKSFSKKLNQFLYDGNILCFPTTLDLAPRLVEITPELLSGEYVPRALGLNAIASLARTPQITIPLAEYNGVPVGISFVGGYGQDMLLVNLCNQLWSCFND